MNAPAPYGAQGRTSTPSTSGDRLSEWSSSTPVRSASAETGQTEWSSPDQRREPVPRYQRQAAPASASPAERGLPGWAALIVLLVIAGIGGFVDVLSGGQTRGGFNYGIVIASLAAILVVRRSGMFPVVIAPPIVYSLASGAMLYIRSGGLHDRRVLFDGAANWLVYGFPAIASATAAVLIVAGIRLIIRR